MEDKRLEQLEDWIRTWRNNCAKTSCVYGRENCRSCSEEVREECGLALFKIMQVFDGLDKMLAIHSAAPKQKQEASSDDNSM